MTRRRAHTVFLHLHSTEAMVLGQWLADRDLTPCLTCATSPHVHRTGGPFRVVVHLSAGEMDLFARWLPEEFGDRVIDIVCPYDPAAAGCGPPCPQGVIAAADRTAEEHGT